MVDGLQSKPKVGFIIQARMRSERLPGKVLLPIPLDNGKSILHWIVNSSRLSIFKPNIILATSADTANDSIQFFCDQNNIQCFRGSEKDVLSRFIDIVTVEQFDVVVRLTGDNPFLDINILDEVITHHIERQNDYTNTVGLPIGMNFEVISGESLLSLDDNDLSEADREHVTMFVRNHSWYKKEVYKIHSEINLSELRMTIDYPSDYLVVSTIMNIVRFPFNVNHLKDLYNTYPWIFEVNIGNIQKKVFNSISEELTDAAALLRKNEMIHAAKKLES